MTPARHDPVIERHFWGLELQHCLNGFGDESGFRYLCRKYLQFKGKDPIGFYPLILNPVQDYVLRRMEDQFARTGKIRQVIGKARQVGMSTLAQAIVFSATSFRSGRNALGVAHDEDMAAELLEMSKTYWDQLPDQLKPDKRYDSKFKMEFEKLHSKLQMNHARNMNVGASTMIHILHATEVSRYPDANTIQSSLFPTISEATGTIFGDCSIVILESTSVYGGDWFKEFAEEARDSDNEYDFTFIPYYMLPAYRRPIPAGFHFTTEEREWLDRYPEMVEENIVWYREKRSLYKSNPMLFIQEYPMSWEESWIMPAGTARIFVPESLNLITRGSIRAGKSVYPHKDGFEDTIVSPLVVWEQPKDGVLYDMGVDPSGGRDARADFTAIEIIRRDTLEQVAEARHHWDPASPEFVDFVYYLGLLYNRAQIIPDISGGWGMTLINFLQSQNYPSIWQQRVLDDIREKITFRIGFSFSKTTKTSLVNNAVMLAYRGEPQIHSAALLTEIRNYLNIGIDEWGPSPGYKDDRVCAWMLALRSATDERLPGGIVEFNVVKTQTKDLINRPDPIFVHNIDADLAGEPQELAQLQPYSTY